MTDQEIIHSVRRLRADAEALYAEGQRMHNEGLGKMGEAQILRGEAEVLMKSLYLDEAARAALLITRP